MGIALVLAMGCRTGGGSEDVVTVTEIADPLSPSEYEARLRDIVRERLAEERAASGPGSAELIHRRPYYYREYNELPQEPGGFDLEFSERESRTTPYSAEVSYPKIRYSTRLHRNRQAAVNDSNFLRDTGVETLSFEVRNGAWREIGSFFVADRTEELVDGEWVALNEQAVRTIPEEEASSRGWFSRTWDWLTFWN